MPKPPLDLEMLGIPLDATLTYADNKDATCTVTNLSPPEVVINGQVVSIDRDVFGLYCSGIFVRRFHADSKKRRFPA